MASLKPAYGRDYKSAKAAQADWDAGLDFVYLNFTSRYDGKYCSKRDFPGWEALELRYNKLQKIVMVRGGAK